MKRLAAIAVLLVAAAGGAWGDVQEEAAERGRAMVVTNCSRCHATGLDDASPHEKAPPFRKVVDIYPSEDLAEALAEGIVSGHPDMPVFVLSPPQIEDFLAYLNSLDEGMKAREPAKE